MKINRHTLFMNYPSTWWHDPWREGLVTGNGVIGANVYGGVKEEITMITHHDLWHNGYEDTLPDVHDAFIRQREKMDREEFREASWEVVNALREKNYATRLESQLPVCDLKVTIDPLSGFSDYVRAMQMDTGEVSCEWTDAPCRRSSRLFVSRRRNIAVKEIRDSEKKMTLLLSLDMHCNQGSVLQNTAAKHVMDSRRFQEAAPYMTYTARNDDGSLFGCAAKILTDGRMEETPLGIRVREASWVRVLLSVFVKEQSDSVLSKLEAELDKLTFSYENLLKEHSRMHRRLYTSAELVLYSGKRYHSNEELLMKAYGGKQSPELIEKLWHYGRYLLICGTGEHSNPFPLYGLWSGEYNLMWSHNMANENTQMIYWHTYVGNLLPLQKGLYSYYNKRIPVFRENAEKLFHMRGVYMTAGTTPGVSTPNQVVPVIMSWVGAAGWIAAHYYEYYCFTKDDAYLEKILLPYLKEVADFYEDYITFYPDGSIHFYPSVSPENTPLNFMPPEHIQMAHPMPTTVNSTIDLAIVREFFTNMIRLAGEKGVFKDRLPLWEKILGSIPEYQISSDGGIREWMDPRFEERYDHRHLSHIYPVFPGTEVNKLHKKELLPYFRRAVELRRIDAQTGWSMGHMAAIYARLEDGEAAMGCLNNMAKSSLTKNFFTLHNDWRGMNISLCMDPAPVQLDAVMGYTNAVQEMLLYVSGDLVKLLPALPKCMPKGSVSGFRYMDGEITMRWSQEKFSAELKAIRKHSVYLQLPDSPESYIFETAGSIVPAENGLWKLTLEKGESLRIQRA